MKIKIRLDFFICLGLLIYTNNLRQYIIFMTFLIIHEIYHLVIGIILDVKPKYIKLYAFGFSIDFYIRNLKPIDILFISVAGPISNLLIALLFGIIDACKYTEYIYINMLLGLFNLIPIYPLDGGRALYSIIEMKYGKVRALRLTQFLSIFILIVLSSFSLYFFIVKKFFYFMIIILYLWHISFTENKRISTYLRLYQILEKSKKYLEIN